VDLNLDTLKREIVEYLDASGFAVFHSAPGTLEGLPMVMWDSERHPDYQMFLDVARKAGAKLVLFASREFETSDLDDLKEQLEECNLTREEQREYESRLRSLRGFEGVTCALELAFDYQSRMYVYELQPDWYQDFINVEEEIMAHLTDDDDDDLDGGDSLGGYFSKN
jgi:hypothetical protein